MRLGFMAGLPRSGTTVVANILNQNKSMYVSPNSQLCEYLRLIHQYVGEDVRLGTLRAEHESLLRGAPAAFYANHEEQYVIDKARTWGMPYYLRLLNSILPGPPRILCPVRPLEEVVTSFIIKAEQNPDTNFIDRCMVEEDFLPYWHKPLNDARVDWLLRPGGMIGSAMLSLSSALNDATSHMFHIYTYQELIDNPSSTLDAIYDFLEVERYVHNFDCIPQGEPQLDMEVLGVPDFHDVRPQLRVIAPDPVEILSDYALTRCMIEDFWTGVISDDHSIA